MCKQKISVLQATESWAGPGNEATLVSCVGYITCCLGNTTVETRFEYHCAFPRRNHSSTNASQILGAVSTEPISLGKKKSKGCIVN